MKIDKKYEKLIETVAVFLCAVIMITICSKASPLYPFNDWDDPNCFFTVGKSMVNGKVLYRDIFEQKGPLLYMLHELTYLISSTTFLGVYFVEIIACFIVLIFSGKIIRLFREGSVVFAVYPLAALLYSSLSFCSGDSAEELCMPLMIYCFYTGMKAVRTDKKITPLQALVCGITLGIVLWVKFTMLGFYIGFILAFVVLYIRQKRIKEIFISALSILGGVLLSTVPVIIYFAKHNAFSDLFEVYFYDNMFLYSTGSDTNPILKAIINLFTGLATFAGYNTFGFLFLIFGFITLKKYQNKNCLFLFSCLAVSTFFFSFVGGRTYSYYSLVMSVFSPVGMVGICDLCEKKFVKLKDTKKKYSVFAVSIVAAFLLCQNTYLMFCSKDDMPQFKFYETIVKTQNATLLNYGFLDGGFYTVSGIVPNCKYFCELNVEYDEMYRTQKEYAEQGKVDFIVTKDEKPEFALYECVDTCEFRYWFGTSSYYLYKVK
ncbi:MAG: hypothetical protein IJ192_12965 [Clostridia bacterium]|nr:hypothetical protein [Clostridia bacterium]